MLQTKTVLICICVIGKSVSGYVIPKGCYGQKQLQCMLTENVSSIKYEPIRPEWCSNMDFLVPQYLKKVEPQESTPPYKISLYPFKNSDAIRVMLKSVDTTTFTDVILVATDKTNDGNWGRFVRSEGIELICCEYTDKDVARFENSKDGVNQIVFYWVPHEVTNNHHEGDITFIATVAKNSKEYWTNVKSSPVDVTPVNTGFKTAKDEDVADYQ